MPADDPFGFRQTRAGRSVGRAVVDHELKEILILEDDFVVPRINGHSAVGGIGIANDSQRRPVQNNIAPIRRAGSGCRLGGDALLPQRGGQKNGSRRGRTDLTSHGHFRQRLDGNQLGVTCGFSSCFAAFATCEQDAAEDNDGSQTHHGPPGPSAPATIGLRHRVFSFSDARKMNGHHVTRAAKSSSMTIVELSGESNWS